METTFTLRNPPCGYLHLELSTENTGSKPVISAIDAITVRTHLSSALKQYLGLTGLAIQIDILKIDPESSGAWVRVPREDERAVVAALSQWAGHGGVCLRVLGKSSWLGGLTNSGTDRKLWSLES